MKKGFTLIELIVTIIVLAIILSIAIPKFYRWKKKEDVKRDIHYLYSILQEARSKAFLNKKAYTIEVNGTDVKIIDDEDNKTIKELKLNTYFYHENNGTCSSVELKLSPHGTFSNQTSIGYFKCNNLNFNYENFNLPYNCIKITQYNLRITKCN